MTGSYQPEGAGLYRYRYRYRSLPLRVGPPALPVVESDMGRGSDVKPHVFFYVRCPRQMGLFPPEPRQKPFYEGGFFVFSVFSQ